MAMDTLLTLLQTITGITLLVGLVLALLAWFYFRRSRRDAFWRQRRNAGLRGFRYSVLAAIALSSSAALCMVSLAVSFVEDDGGEVAADSVTAATPSPSPTFTLTPFATPTGLEISEEPENTAAASLPLVPSLPPVATATLLPTATQTPVILPTAAAAFVEIWAVDTQISANFRPIQPSTIFASNTRRLYFYLNYRGIDAGTLWERTLLRDGEILRQDRQQWGMTPLEGETFFFFGSDTGFDTGNYELRVRFGEANPITASVTFTVVSP